LEEEGLAVRPMASPDRGKKEREIGYSVAQDSPSSLRWRKGERKEKGRKEESRVLRQRFKKRREEGDGIDCRARLHHMLHQSSMRRRKKKKGKERQEGLRADRVKIMEKRKKKEKCGARPPSEASVGGCFAMEEGRGGEKGGKKETRGPLARPQRKKGRTEASVVRAYSAFGC